MGKYEEAKQLNGTSLSCLANDEGLIVGLWLRRQATGERAQ